MTKWKVYGSRRIIEHNNEEEFNDKLEFLIVSALMTNHIIDYVYHTSTTGYNNNVHVLYFNNSNGEPLFDIMFYVDDKDKLMSFFVYDRSYNIKVENNIFEFCHARITKG